MINLDEINGEILKLEGQPTTYAVIERLSWLYTVRDHLSPVSGEIPHGRSEFMKACSGKKVCDVMAIIDEMMTIIQAVQPRLYHAVLDKLP